MLALLCSSRERSFSGFSNNLTDSCIEGRRTRLNWLSELFIKIMIMSSRPTMATVIILPEITQHAEDIIG